jgi:hypothetical protein
MTYSHDFMAGWLSGFFDGEGSAVLKETVNGKKHTNYFLSVSNTDAELMKQCSYFLDVLEIGHTKWTYRAKTPNRKPFATLHICRAPDIIQFFLKVGFGAPHKAEILRKIVAWIERPAKYDDVLPVIAARNSKGESLRSIVLSLGLCEGAHHAMGNRLREAGFPVHTGRRGRRSKQS